jgi:membrane protein implicated in regulation of membrane protease activity
MFNVMGSLIILIMLDVMSDIIVSMIFAIMSIVMASLLMQDKQAQLDDIQRTLASKQHELATVTADLAKGRMDLLTKVRGTRWVLYHTG